MKQNQSPASAPAREALPLQVDVKIHALHASGPVLADASVNLNGCFAIRGVKVVEGSNGPFVSMPSYKGRDGYKDVCFPCTSSTQVPYPSLPGKPESSLIPLCLLFAADPLRWALPRCSIRRCWTPASRRWPRSPSASRSAAGRISLRPSLK